MDVVHDAGGDIRWISYRELADARGISLASAKRIANRRRWPRQAGNDGTARVGVPQDEMQPARDVPQDDGADVLPGVVEALTAIVGDLRGMLADHSDRLAAALEGKARAESEAAALREQLATATARRRWWRWDRRK
jgi:hypothetical protein